MTNRPAPRANSAQPARSPRPQLYGNKHQWALIHADSLVLLSQLPDHCIDAVITDPPYGLAFNGEQWDGGYLADGDGFQAFCTTWLREVRRVLKPGGHAAIFGATRTFHRLVCGAEDAGLEIRDQLLWLYDSGMPKSRRIPGGRAGMLGSALKPAYEPILLARAPLKRLHKGKAPTIVDTLERHGTGALNIDATRMPCPGHKRQDPKDGYWPANVLLEHHQDCQREAAAGECHQRCTTAQIDQLAGKPVSRIFYAAKASRQEREAGCEHLETTATPIFSDKHKQIRPRANAHPTVKPLDLMRYLTRLIAPQGGLVLDPFTGSGSTGAAAMLERRQFLGIECDSRYLPIARARLAHWAKEAKGNVDLLSEQ